MERKRILELQAIDVHVHDRGLNQSHVATPLSESKAALAGGFVGYLAMPNTSPPVIDQQSLEAKLDEASDQTYVYYGAFLAGINGNQQELQQAAKKACGLKLYMNNTTGDLLIDDALELNAHFQKWNSSKPICVHAEAYNGALEVAINLCRRYRKKTHICHVATRDEILMIKKAKVEGLPITCEVTPHHLFLCDEDVTNLGSLGMMKPALATKKDQEALWHHFDVIDCIATDHAPHLLKDKYSDNPPYGVPGLETAIPLMLHAVAEGRLTIEDLQQKVSINPQKIFGIECLGRKGTFATIDTTESYYIDQSTQLYTACGWTPFVGHKVTGRVREVYIAGELVFKDGVIHDPIWKKNLILR